MQRKKYSPEFKEEAALEAIRERQTASELCSQYGVHFTMIGRWRQQAVEHIKSGFSNKREKEEKNRGEITASLYQQIGQLKVEPDRLKKKSAILKQP